MRPQGTACTATQLMLINWREPAFTPVQDFLLPVESNKTINKPWGTEQSKMLQ